MERIKSKLFIPNSATLSQVHDILYWLKGKTVLFNQEFLNCGGIIIEFWIEKEYFTNMLVDLNKCDGLVVEKKVIRNILQT